MSETSPKSPGKPRVLVVGGGISGLATAWFLMRAGAEVRLIEAAEHVGGTVGSEREDGFLVERGPNTTLQKPGRPEDALGRLIEGAGLATRMRVAAPAGARRFILRDGLLMALPGSPPAFLATPAFSWAAKLRLVREPFIRPSAMEESVAEFTERRLGREFLNYAVDPFISGVYAGDPATLSVQAAVPRIYEVEQTYGSLIRGAIKLGRAAKGAGMPAGRQISFDDGMAVLPQTLAARLPAGAVRTACPAVALERTEGGWTVRVDGGGPPETADKVVLAMPAPAIADLVAPLSGEAADLLKGISYAPIVVVGLGYARDRVGHALNGFGFLVPRVESVRTLGALFSSTLFEGRAPEGQVLLTTFIGGTRDAGALDLTDDELVDQIEVDLASALDIRAPASFRKLVRYRRAIPQYAMGHIERIEAIRARLSPFGGLHLGGNWQGGISMNDCVRNAETLAARIIAGQTR